jgi:TonB family protein
MSVISRHKIFVIAILFASAMIIPSGSGLFACSCTWGGPFMVAADGPDTVIVRAKILSYNQMVRNGIYLFMDIEVHEVLNGTITTDKLRVRGDDGASCLSYVTKFPINTEWILALGGGSQGYSIPSCGTYWLRVEDGNVVGNITDLHTANQKMPLSEFTTTLKEIKTPSMPKAFILMSGSDKPTISGKGVTLPILLESPASSYPDEAKRKNIEGDVIVHAIVRKDGAIDKIRIIGSLDHDLDRLVMDTIGSRWRFAPGKVSGEPVDVRTIIRYRFRIDHPLRVVIIEDKWEFGSDPGMDQSTTGYGNLIENGLVRGFQFTIPSLCEFGKEEYPAVWKEPESRLEIRVYNDSSSAIPVLYKLQVTMKDFMYQKKDGALITLPIGTAERKN